ncbi:MAG: response regulator [Cryomorphaceae bacterium]|nr:response regulator [Cryomorphaceae bacterium]
MSLLPRIVRLHIVFCFSIFHCFSSLDIRAQTNEVDIPQADSLTHLLAGASEARELELYRELFEVYFPNHLQQAYTIDKNIIALSRKLQIDSTYLEGLNNLGAIYNHRGQFDSVLIVSQHILDIAKSKGDQKSVANAYCNIASAHERTGSLDSALYYNNLAYNSEGLKRKYSLDNNIGRIYFRQNKYPLAVDHFKRSIAGATEAGDLNTEAIVSNNIGNLFAGIQNYSLAEHYYSRSLALKNELGDQKGQLYALVNLANLPDVDSLNRMQYLESGFELAKLEQDERILAIFTSLLCEENHPLTNCPSDVLTAYDKFKDQPSFEFTFIIHAMITNFLRDSAYEAAEVKANEYLQFSTQQQSLEDQQSARNMLLRIYEQTGNAEKYMTVSRVYYAVKDSISQSVNLNAFAYMQSEIDNEKNERINSLNASLEAQKKSRNRIIILSLAIAVLLAALLFNRSRLVRFQRQTITKEKEAGRYLETMNVVLKEQQEFKKRFYSNVTHEFKTPLTVIKGSIQQIQNEKRFLEVRQSDPDLAKRLDSIERNSNNLMELVSRFLELSKLDEHALKVDLVEGDLTGYIYYLTESFESLLKDKQIAFEIQGQTLPIDTSFDPEKIRHIVSNLLSNAIKHTPIGRRIELKLSATEAHYQMVLSDNGEGIPNDELPFIFDRYYRVKNQESTEGTGIGLALTKELVELMGGSIQAHSTLGEGSTFTVSLPIQKSSNTLVESNAHATSGLEDDKRPLILVVEDNQEVSKFIVSCIEYDYRFAVASNGEEGVIMALELLPDLIITDISMPLKDGFQVCEEIKENELSSHIPIIMLTAKASYEAKLQGLEKGADDYLEKPFDVREMLLRIQNLIDIRESIRAHFQTSDTLHIAPRGSGLIDRTFFTKVYQIIDDNIQNSQLGVDFLAREIGISAAHLNRKLKALTNLSTTKFILNHKLKHAKNILLNSDANVSEVADQSGFNSVAYFVKCFREFYGQTPGSLIKDQES